MAIQQNDPGELLEIFDASGQPTGRAASRAAIHTDGYWHQAFHCWIVRKNKREVVLQRRALAKDTFAGYWDAAAAGHWRFGETPEEAAREIAEELGLEVNFSRLAYRGRERLSRKFPNGLTDREFHQVFVLECDRALIEYRPDPREVSGLAAFSVDELIALQRGRQSRVRAVEAVGVDAVGALSPQDVIVGRDDLVPYTAARLRRMLGSAASRLVK
jgi:isopentenyldiphosphate isomerase